MLLSFAIGMPAYSQYRQPYTNSVKALAFELGQEYLYKTEIFENPKCSYNYRPDIINIHDSGCRLINKQRSKLYRTFDNKLRKFR